MSNFETPFNRLNYFTDLRPTHGRIAKRCCEGFEPFESHRILDSLREGEEKGFSDATIKLVKESAARMGYSPTCSPGAFRSARHTPLH